MAVRGALSLEVMGALGRPGGTDMFVVKSSFLGRWREGGTGVGCGASGEEGRSFFTSTLGITICDELDGELSTWSVCCCCFCCFCCLVGKSRLAGKLDKIVQLIGTYGNFEAVGDGLPEGVLVAADRFWDPDPTFSANGLGAKLEEGCEGEEAAIVLWC